MYKPLSNRVSFCNFLVCMFLLPALASCAFFGAKLESSDGKIPRVVQTEVKPRSIQARNTHAFFGAKLEPLDSRIYHGAQAEVPLGLFSRHVDWNGLEEYTKACGHRPKLIMHYISFDPLAFWLLKSTIFEISQQPYDYIPQIKQHNSFHII